MRFDPHCLAPVIPSRRETGLPLATFIALGLPTGALGVAWPAIRTSLGAPVRMTCSTSTYGAGLR